MYIELQLGACGAQVVLPAYAAERGQCSPGQGDPGQFLAATAALYFGLLVSQLVS